MQQGYQCPNCGQSLTYVPMYQNWFCQSCGIYPFAMQAPVPYAHAKKDELNSKMWNKILIVFITIVITMLLVWIGIASQSGNISNTPTTPTGAMDFNEGSIDGTYTGSFVSLSKSVKLSNTQITILDDSLGLSDSINDLSLDKNATVSGGLTLQYNDININSKVDGGDTIRVSNADSKDIIKFVYEPTGGVIASYTFI